MYCVYSEYIRERAREKTTFPPYHPALKIIPTFLCLDNSTTLLLFQEASPSTSLLCARCSWGSHPAGLKWLA